MNERMKAGTNEGRKERMNKGRKRRMYAQIPWQFRLYVSIKDTVSG
jgi:hypothetical protein